MSRWVVVGCVALSAVAAVAVVDVGTATVEAAPSVSPFEGTYVWDSWPATITISDGGRIASSYNFSDQTKGSISGRVGADGGYSFTKSWSFPIDDEGQAFPGGTKVHRQSYKDAGTMASDADGDIVGTPDTGGSFVWSLQ